MNVPVRPVHNHKHSLLRLRLRRKRQCQHHEREKNRHHNRYPGTNAFLHTEIPFRGCKWINQTGAILHSQRFDINNQGISRAGIHSPTVHYSGPA
jgi:hypothetical protein